MNEIIIHEVGLRDGLQIENTIVPTEHKIDWAWHVMGGVIHMVQLGSFVHPKKVPQMADTDALFKYFSLPENKHENVILTGLVLNQKGLERGLDCGVDLFCMGVSASNTHSQKNTGMSVIEAQTEILKMINKAFDAGRDVQASVQSAFGCGYEGKVEKEAVLDIVKRYLDAGVKTVSLADTAGHAHPEQVTEMFGEIQNLSKDVKMACHFHNTYGLGLANCYAAYKAGVTYFESAFGGMGGCPFTQVTSGNVCTEDLVYMMQKMGQCQDISIDILIDLTQDISRFLNRELAGNVHKVWKG